MSPLRIYIQERRERPVQELLQGVPMMDASQNNRFDKWEGMTMWSPWKMDRHEVMQLIRATPFLLQSVIIWIARLPLRLPPIRGRFRTPRRVRSKRKALIYQGFPAHCTPRRRRSNFFLY